MRVRSILLTFLLSIAVLVPARCHAQNSTQTTPHAQTAQNNAAYSLPPEKLKQAIDYSRVRVALDFAESGWGILQLVLILAFGIAAWFERAAMASSGNRWAQGLVFAFLFLLVTTLVTLPLDMYGHHEAVAYGQSVQGWPSWFGDQGKSFVLTLVVGWLFVMLLTWVMRRSPRRWWFWFWIPAMAAVIFGVFVAPMVIDPMFNRFEPLARTDPTLVSQLEQVARRGGIQIPPSRMYLMKASAKVTGLNAYVTGIGPSKRVVVWDTTIQKATPDEILFIFGHEMGHYVLGHIRATIEFMAALLLIEFYLGYLAFAWMIRRYGTRWKIHSQNGWAAVVVLVLVFSVLSFLSEPIVNGYSRLHEHEADVYGQEAIHGIVPDPQTTARQAFQLLGETSLSDPSPNPFVEFWTFSHPSVSERAAFATAYNPWLPGQHPRYFQHE